MQLLHEVLDPGELRTLLAELCLIWVRQINKAGRKMVKYIYVK